MTNMETESESSQALAHSLSGIAAKSRAMTLDDILAAYDEIERSFLPRVGNDSHLALETKRRVAELKLYAAIDKRAPLPRCRGFFDAIDHLGYSNFEKRANVALIYARYCLISGANDEARTSLIALRTELRDRLRQEETPLDHALLTTTEGILRELDEPPPGSKP